MNIVGVTGTNGKTTCVHLICSLIKDRLNCANFGTLGIKHYINNECFETKTTLTTLGNKELHQNLQNVINLGCEFIAMEVSSHGLIQNRVAGVEFTDVVFTNLSHEHLDYHKNMESYFQAKVKLFTNYCGKLKRAIINLDDPYGVRLIKLLQDNFKTGMLPLFEIIGFSVKNLKSQSINHDINLGSISLINCEAITFTSSGINAKIHSPWGSGNLKFKLLGIHNLSNLLASIAVCIKQLTFSEILHKCNNLEPATGRLQNVMIDNHTEIDNFQNEQNLFDIPKIFIDYAHTPDGLENALLALKQHYAGLKICCIFGCGGDRDPTKRSEMLKVAEKYCNVVILTQDNSRNEDPQKIIQDILSHRITNSELKLIIEMNRLKAINIGINEYCKDHIMLIAGKGHETKQIIGNSEYFFCDYTIAKEALNNLYSFTRVGVTVREDRTV